MDFRPGELSQEEAGQLNRMWQSIVRLDNLRVAGPTMRIYRGPANIVIESIAQLPAGPQSGSGSGGSGSTPHDLVTISFDALSDVAVTITEFTVTCVAGVISATLTIATTKTYERVFITGPDLSVVTHCNEGGPC